MKKYALTLIFLLVALCAFASDVVVVTDSDTELILTKDGATITYYGKIENISNKEALVRYIIVLVDAADHPIKDGIQFEDDALKPHEKKEFHITKTFPVAVYADTNCSGYHVLVIYGYKQDAI